MPDKAINSHLLPIIKKYWFYLAVLVFVLTIPILKYPILLLHSILDQFFYAIYIKTVYSSATYENVEQVKEIVFSAEWSGSFFIALYRFLVGLRPTGSGGEVEYAIWFYLQIYGLKSAFFGFSYSWIIKRVSFFAKKQWTFIFPALFHGWGVIFASIILIFRYYLYQQEQQKE